mmetsp:Transcript_42015/g.97958  ORF Transcript_42015/g.97958 Transcript_42015/m.97958 type:complete len:276 (+) Transcript_42015:84-911(+)
MNTPVRDIISAHQDTFDALLRELQGDLHRSVVCQGELRDVWLVRFCTGFDWKVPAIAEKFRNMLSFRERYKVDDIRRKYEEGMKPSEIPGYGVHHDAYMCTFLLHTGQARDRSPVNLEQTCKFKFADLAAIEDSVADQYIIHNLKYHSFVLDKAYLESKCLKGYVKMMDLAGAHMSQMSWVSKWASNSKHRKVRLDVDIMECYPELFSKVFVIHSPMFFSVVWKVIKPFIPARTCDKVKVESSSSKSKVLCTEAVDPSILPTEFGGAYTGQWMMK